MINDNKMVITMMGRSGWWVVGGGWWVVGGGWCVVGCVWWLVGGVWVVGVAGGGC